MYYFYFFVTSSLQINEKCVFNFHTFVDVLLIILMQFHMVTEHTVCFNLFFNSSNFIFMIWTIFMNALWTIRKIVYSAVVVCTYNHIDYVH